MKAKKKTKAPLVEVMVMSYNNKGFLDKCLISLKKAKYGNLKITVIDNASSDGSPEMIRKKYPEVNLIANMENLGFSKGNNAALKKTKAKYAILLNDDTEHESGWISELVDFAEKHEDAAALQPKFRSMRNRKMFEYAGAAGGFMDIYGYPVCRGRIFEDVEEDKGQYDDAREIFWSCGGAMLLRVSVLRKIGYLDEVMGNYAEELDLCWRMNLAGYKQYFVPSAVIYHFGAGSWGKKKLKFKKEFLTHRNHWIALFKNYDKGTWIRIMPFKIFLETATFFGFLLKNPVKSAAVLRANLWIAAHLPLLNRMNREISGIRKVSDGEMMKKMIKRSVAVDRFVLGNKRKFPEYARFIENYKN